MSLCDFQVTCSLVQIAHDRIPQVRTGQPRRRCEGLEHGETDGRPLRFGYRYRTVHRVQRRRIDALQDRVQIGDVFPPRRLERRREAVLRGDAGLGVKSREHIPSRRALQPLGANPHSFPIPQ